MPRVLVLMAAVAAALSQPAMAADAGAETVARQWDAFLRQGTTADVNAAIDAMDAVGYSVDAVDAGKCREHAAGLADAQRRLPVSIALQRAALLCAEATGDHEGAERASSAVAALARVAFDTADRGAWPRPVRIVLPGDAYALFASAGMQFRYELYSELRAEPYFPLMIAEAAPDSGVEKLVRFDYVDVLQAIDRGTPSHGTPRLRAIYAESFVDAAVKRGEVAGIDYMALKAAAQESGPQQKVAALRDAAMNGGLNSAATWLLVCAGNSSPGCADGLVDALLPQAEQRHAYPMLLLATAYLEGVGVPADAKAAEAMLDAADRAWDRRGASVAFADLFVVLHPGEPATPFLRKRLQAAHEAGNAAALPALVAIEMARKDEAYQLTASDEALLANPDNNGLGHGLFKLAGWYESRDKARSDAYLQRAADAGNSDALRILAVRLRETQGSKPPTPETLDLLARAANGGDAYAMYYMGYQAYMQGNPKRAEDWVIPAALRGDAGATFFLAGIWAEGHEGLDGDPAQAVKVYEELAGTDEYGAEARRSLAGLAIAGKGMDKDPARARAWLLRDAEAGDAESQVMLGGMLLAGMLGEKDEAAGREWMERAIAAKSVDAMNQYGLWLHNHGKDAADRAHGVQLSRQAAEDGDIGAMNNAAWMLCVSPHDDVRKPVEGMVLARKLEATPDIGPGTIDTVAACLAAVGEFEQAVEMQQRVVDDMKRLPSPDPDSLKAMEARLALYRAGKPYIEMPEDADS